MYKRTGLNSWDLVWEENFPDYSERLYRALRMRRVHIELFLDDPDRIREMIKTHHYKSSLNYQSMGQ